MKAKKILLTLLLAVTVVALCAFSLSVEVKADLTPKCETITVDRYAHPYPESSHSYANNSYQTKTFTYPGASEIAITFSDNTYVEPNYDFIYLYDGNGNLYGSYTGREAAGVQVVIYDDTFKILLTSDVSVSYYGYSFSSIEASTHVLVTEGDASGRCTQHGEPVVTKCTDCDYATQTTSFPLGHTTNDGTCQRCNANIVAGNQVPTMPVIGENNLCWALDDQGTLTVFGSGGASGYAYYYDVMSAPWYNYKDQVRQVVIENGITGIGAYWFTGCRRLTHVDIAESVTFIGDGAFQNCLLSSVGIPASVTHIGHNVFDGCELRTLYYGGSTHQWDCIQFGNNQIFRTVLMEYNHVHNYSVSFVEQPTCTYTGFTQYTCVYGESYRVAIPALGHNDVSMPAAEPTCTTAGRKADGIWCEYCNAVSKAPTTSPALGHNFTNYVSDNNATYDADGTKTAKCDRCDATDTVIDVGTKLIRNGWFELNGQWYYFKNDVKQTGWLKSGNTWYYFDSEGAMASGWQKIGSAWYYFDAEGAMLSGWQKIGTSWYYFNSSGAMLSGWQKIGAAWYYFKSSGAMAAGWQKIGNAWYYFQGSGAMLSGWQKIGNAWYYFQGSGAMATGKVTIGGKQHSFNASGVWQGEVKQNGWVSEGGKWCYYQNGTKLTGWKNLGGSYYYFNGSGAMQTGWLKSGNAWYYLKSSGTMATGWQKIGTTWYYFQSSGAMATGWQKIGSAWYYFLSGGTMKTGWLKQGSTWYYFNGNGAMATGSLKIGSKTYRFNNSGACLNP